MITIWLVSPYDGDDQSGNGTKVQLNSNTLYTFDAISPLALYLITTKFPGNDYYWATELANTTTQLLESKK